MRLRGIQIVRGAAVLAAGMAAWATVHSRAIADPPTAPAPASASTSRLPPGVAECAWIAGSWSGEHDGGIIEEHWTSASGGTMSGMARLVVGGKTVFHEYLRIVTAPEGGAEYEAQPGGRCPAVAFRLTRATPTEAVFENPAHDNPTLIRYRLEDGGQTLVAVTEGTEKGERIVHETRMKRATLTGAD